MTGHMNINSDFDRQSEVFHSNAKGHGVIAEHVFQPVKQSNIHSSYETTAKTCTIDCSSYRKDLSYNDETGTNDNVVKEKITDVRFIKDTELVFA